VDQRMPEAGRVETVNCASGVGVTARALTRRFGNHLALERVDLQIAPRARFSLLGANGAGKTTFIRMLTGFLLPSSGALTVDGISPARHPHAVNKRIGFAMETSRLYPHGACGAANSKTPSIGSSNAFSSRPSRPDGPETSPRASSGASRSLRLFSPSPP